jgi:hypothetical protein
LRRCWVLVRTIAGVPFVFDLRTGLFSVELLVHDLFELDHFGGVVWGVVIERFESVWLVVDWT